MKNKAKKSKFELKFYEGYKRGETPRAVIIGNREFKIDKVIWRKRIQDQKTGKTHEIFKCMMEGDKVKITIHESGKWEISF